MPDPSPSPTPEEPRMPIPTEPPTPTADRSLTAQQIRLRVLGALLALAAGVTAAIIAILLLKTALG